MNLECEKQVAAALQACGIDADAALLAGVSGGADSVALLHILKAVHHGPLYVAHLHHGIRGRSADEDEAFVRGLAGRWGLPYRVGFVDVPALAKAEGKTIEEAARIARYTFFSDEKKACGADYIVTAHHMDDQAETVLMNLLRGCSLAGLAGMRPRQGDILRPMLCIPREEILQYISGNGLSYRTDETNLEPGCMRNRLRLELMPLLKKDYNPAITRTLAGMAELIGADEAYLCACAEAALDGAAAGENAYRRSALNGLPGPIKSRAIRRALDGAGMLYGMQRPGIERICALLDAPTGVRAPLPHGKEAYTSYDLLIIGAADGEEAAEAYAIPFRQEGVTETPFGRFEARYAPRLRKDEGAYVAYFDADKLPGDMLVRERRPGDRFYPLGAAGTRKLKEYLIDKKLPRESRQTPLIASGGKVLFFPGGTSAHDLRVTEDTKRILRVEYIKAETRRTE